MKIATSLGIVLVVIALIVLAVGPFGGDRGGAADTPGAALAAPDAPGDEVLAALMRTYQDAPVLQDAMSLKYTTDRNVRTYEYGARFDGDRMALDLPDSEMFHVDGRFYMTLNSNPGKYIGRDAPGGTLEAFTAVAGRTLLPVNVAMRFSDDRVEVMRALSLGQIENPRVGATELITGDDGRTLRSLTLQGDNGRSTVTVDPDTGFLVQAVTSYTPRDRNDTWKMDARFEVGTELDAPIEFDPGDRYLVDAIPKLKAAAVGEPAPDFALPTIDGETIVLSDLRGSVVVLDFWATWCGPCKKGLPLIEELHRWAEQSGKPIKVVAVDVWERYSTAETKTQAVTSFWRDNGFTMPTVMDLTGTAALPWGIKSIPATIIIDPSGRIVKIHRGYDPEAVVRLKREVEEILQDA